MKPSRDIRNFIASRSENVIKIFADIGYTISCEDFDSAFKEIAEHELEVQQKKRESWYKFYKTHPEAWAEISKRSYEKHREARIAHVKAYNAAHADERKAYRQKRARLIKAFIRENKELFEAFKERFEKLEAQAEKVTDAVG